jgi:hypothetical protein
MSCLFPLNKTGSCAQSAIRIKWTLICTDILYHGTQFISLAVSNSKQLQHLVAFHKLAACNTQQNCLTYNMKYCGMLQVTNCSFSLNLSLLLYDLLHTSTCMHWCLFRWLCWINDLSHTSHLNERSPPCIRWCLFRWLCRMNDLSHITSKWTLSTMYALMCLQNTLLTERLITYITSKWLLPTAYVLMCLQITLLTERLIAYIKMAAPHCVCADASSDDSADWMTYYTHHI